jgi:DNA-binding response OmpR family regulator
MNGGISLRLLLIEDERRLAERISAALREVGFLVDHAADGVIGVALAEKDVFDAIILDLMLPGNSGKAVLHALRGSKRQIPVLVVATQKATESVVDLLNSGADDYLAKPFDLQELIARVKALIRRSKGTSTPVLQLDDIEVDTIQQTVSRSGQKVDLSPTEYRILEYLALRAGAIVSKRELLDHIQNGVWKHPANVIEVHVSNLRRKLNISGEEELIETLRRRGYKIREGTPR